MKNRDRSKRMKTSDEQAAVTARTEMSRVTERLGWDFYACIAISVAAFCFIFYRIFHVSFAMDEWGMWNNSIKPGLSALITFQQKETQCHFLQGLIAMPFLKWLSFPPAESTRIPSLLLMFPLYAWSGMHLAKTFIGKPWLRVLCFSSWICPQIILEYFGMTRGYAHMLAFGGVSYVGLLEAFNSTNTDSQKDKWTKVSIVGAACATLSILTFAYGYFIVTFLLLTRYFLNASGQKTFWSRIIETFQRGNFIIWTGILLFVFYLPRYLLMINSVNIPWAGKHDVISDSFASFLGAVLYIPYDVHYIVNPSGISNWITYSVFSLCIMYALAFLCLNLLQSKLSVRKLFESNFMLSCFVLFGSLFLMQLLFWLCEIQMPIRRTVLFLWPAFVMFLIFATIEIKSRIVGLLNVGLLLAIVGYSITTYNIDFILETNGDQQNKEITNALCELADNLPENRPMIVGVTDCMRYTIWYYLEYEHGLKPVPQFETHPIFKMFGDNKIFLYSLSYGYPQPFPPIWHHFPFSPDYYLLSPYEPGQQPNPRLMEMTPVYECKKSRAAIYKAKTPDGPLGCDVKNCFVCQALYQMAGQQQK